MEKPSFMFRKAKQNRIFQDVVDQIQEIVLSRKLPPGSRLPSERELKEMFQVSRGTLREALRILEQKGLIEIKLGVGGGAFVKEVGYEQVSESLALLIRYQKISLFHLSEFRKTVDGDVTALAAQRATPDDIQRLRDLLVEAKEYVKKGYSFVTEFINSDKKIHLAIAEISRNPIYVSLQHTIHDNIDQYYESFLSMKEREMEENYQDLVAIVGAIETHKKREARSLAREHVLRFNHYMETHNEQ